MQYNIFKNNKYQETISTCKEILAYDCDCIDAFRLISKSLLAIKEIDSKLTQLDSEEKNEQLVIYIFK